MALTTYESQVEFSKRWIKEGRCQVIGTWQQGAHSGKIWCGEMGRWRIHFHTLGRMLKVGTFRVSIKKPSTL